MISVRYDFCSCVIRRVFKKHYTVIKVTLERQQHFSEDKKGKAHTKGETGTTKKLYHFSPLAPFSDMVNLCILSDRKHKAHLYETVS